MSLQHAREQGLSPEGRREALQNPREKMKTVAARATVSW
jgi:hypothetical protein